MNTLFCLAWVLGLGPWAPAAEAAEGMKDKFTASPERRAELLAKAQARNREQSAAKSTGAMIVENGQAAAVIVCRDEMPAAKLLQDWVRRMSGAELPIADQPVAGRTSVYVGQAAVDAGLKLADLQSRSNEGLAVKCDGRSVFIAGQSAPATVRAVGRFLEEEFGCRWLADTEWGQVYPELKTLRVRTGEFRETPGFVYRRIWGPEGAFRNVPWNLWNGDGGLAIPMSHSWNFLGKEDFKLHPEWFRLDETGKRINGPWFNLGHPEVRKRFLEWALKASDGGRKSISLSPPDDHREDFSPEARRYDNPDVIDPSSGRVSMTDRFVGIANEAATALHKLNPANLCGFYAYSDYTLPPTKPELAKLSPALCVWIAPIRYSRYHPLGHPNSPSIQQLKQIIDDWSGHATSMGLRTYNYNLAEVLTPFSKISTWAHDLPYLRQRGFIGASLESFNDWEIYAPHLYLSIRLSYDPRLDPWEIMADYWVKAYGPAAAVMEKYWLEVDAAFINLKTDAGSIHALHHVYTPERLKLLDGHLTEAERLVKGTKGEAYRVSLARRGLTRANFWRSWYDAMNLGNIDGAAETLMKWGGFVKESIASRNANKYADTYLQRFVGKNTWSAWGAVHPKQGKPRKPIGVLPDGWKTATKEEIEKSGAAGKPFDVKFPDTSWKPIKTFTDTRNAQGLPEYFGEMWYRTSFKASQSSTNLALHFVKADRKVVLYINGAQVNATEVEAFAGATLDVSGHLKPGQENQITVMVRHIPLPEMYLGGLVGPVYVLEQTE